MARSSLLMRFGLRSKILLGFGGLLFMLGAVSVLGETVLTRYSNAMQRVFKEDYLSVAACEDLAHAVDHIDTALQLHFWQGIPLDPSMLDEWRRRVDTNVQLQRANVTLPGEAEITARLVARWEEYKRIYPALLDTKIAGDVRQADYARRGLPKAIELETAAHELIDMNMRSMLLSHTRVRPMAEHFRSAMRVLEISAIGLAAVFALLISRFILNPVRVLTDSVREIERGNLDLRVPVQANDELGALAEAVNAMAAQLLAYRKADYERLVRTEQTTQLAIDSLPDAVVVLNPTGHIEMASEPARRLFKLTPGASVDHPDTPWLADIYRRILHHAPGPALGGYESTIQVEDRGEMRYFLPRAVPILSVSEQVIGATVVLADVTGLRRLDEMKNGLLSLVSHELKTPLTSMRMVLHLVAAQRVGPLTSKQKELLDAARDDAERLHAIVENLLDMARIESGRALMELQDVLPGALIEKAAESLRGAFEGQQVEFTVSMPGGLPAVSADATRIGHVLLNLLTNSLRHTPAGGHVRLWARRADDWVEMGVTDDGEGIPRQYLPRVFEKFFRVPGQPGGSGSGLGLSIAKDIVQAHGGRIRADSTEGRGTTFAFTLRCAEIVDVSATSPASLPVQSASR